jgi:hypothetical protein
MSKYNINDIVLSKCGFEGKLLKFRVIGVERPSNDELDDIICFRYEYDKDEDILKDPYVYEISLHSEQDNEVELSPYEINIFSHKKGQLTTQIYGKC